ncbi:hypothetical protein QYP02_16855 [Pseudomonas aeruginosa]|nr:hypothetical protein [Pseudomonas aeruginosa]
MRKIREVLRLKFDCGLSVRKIARSLGTGHSSGADSTLTRTPIPRTSGQ